MAPAQRLSGGRLAPDRCRKIDPGAHRQAAGIAAHETRFVRKVLEVLTRGRHGNPPSEMLLLTIRRFTPGVDMADELQSDGRRCLMSFTLQLPPQATTRAMRDPVRSMGLDGGPEEGGFFSSWLKGKNDLETPRRHINRCLVAGFAISLMISGGFWTGVGVLVAQALK